MGLLSNNAFTKPGGFTKNVNMPLLLAGMSMMGNSDNPMQAGVQGLLGGLQYKRQQEQDLLAQAQRKQQQAHQQAMLKMQQQKFQMAQSQHQQSQKQQQAYQKYIAGGGFTPQQQATLSALPMQQGVQMIKSWQTPQKAPEVKTAKGADGFLYFVSGPKAGQRAIPNAQKAPEPAFAGNGLTNQALSIVSAYDQMIKNGKQPTEAETRNFELAKMHLARPTTISTPQGTRVQPGYDLAGYGQPSNPVPQAANPAQPASTGTPPGYGFTPKKDDLPAHLTLSAGFAGRMEQASGHINKIMDGGKYNPSSASEHIKGAVPLAGNYLVSEEHQLYEQAKRNWVTANLRKESGANIPDDELANEYTKYFPLPGDSEKTIKQKAAARAKAEDAMRKSAGRAYTPHKPEKEVEEDEIASLAARATRTKTIGNVKFYEVDGKWYQ